MKGVPVWMRRRDQTTRSGRPEPAPTKWATTAPIPTTTPVPAPAASTFAPACNAPFGSMYLDQRGFARICAANNTHVLGNLAHHRLRDLWDGPVAREVREAIAAHNYDAGCQLCGWQVREGSAENAYARVFDAFDPEREPAWPRQIEFALGNVCNLQCVMCTGDQSSTIRSRREHLPAMPKVYGDAFFEDLVPFLDHLERAKFLGGEPFLIPEHHRVWDLMIQGGHAPDCHVTTNGTQWNERIERVLDHLPISLAISMDGIRPETVAEVRLGADLATILANLERFRRYTEQRGTYLSLTYCLMTQNWDEFDEFLRFADDRNLSVFVNTVLSPSRMSLYRLPLGELAEIVAELERRDPEAQRTLDLNRGVWDDQLGRLRHRLAVLGDERVEADPFRPGVTRWGHLAHSEGDPGPDPWTEVTDWADGGPVVEITVDEHDLVIGQDRGPKGFLTAPIDLAGLGMDELTRLLESQFGRQVFQQPAETMGRTVLMRAEYEDDRGRTQVRLWGTPLLGEQGAPDRLRWVIGSRRAPETTGSPESAGTL